MKDILQHIRLNIFENAQRVSYPANNIFRLYNCALFDQFENIQYFLDYKYRHNLNISIIDFSASRQFLINENRKNFVRKFRLQNQNKAKLNPDKQSKILKIKNILF